MRYVAITALLHSTDPQTAYDTLRDFDNFVRLSDAVREIVITKGPGGSLESHWEVNFRSGILKWSERDRFDDANRKITFEGIGGDFAHLVGEWLVESANGSTAVHFIAHFDMGIASLQHIVEPVAEGALIENVHLILQGMFGDAQIAPLAEMHGGE